MTPASAPSSYKQVKAQEVWYDPDADEVLILGEPTDDTPFEDGGHSCDHMGCGSWHVLYRAKVVRS